MVNFIKVSDFARRKGVSERTVRNWIKKGKLSTTTKTIENRSTLVIILESNSEHSEAFNEDLNENIQDDSGPIQEAEIIPGSASYSLVSMEKTTFEQLIESIKSMSESRAEADQDTINRFKEEIFEIKAENKKLNTDIKQLNDLLTKEKIESAQLQAELKIKDLRIKELEEQIDKFQLEKYDKINNSNQDKDKNNTNIWNRINKNRKL
ncbi:MAG: hypothetical protein AB1782_00895 [Cyanobacteriota bacterium]